MGRHSTPRTTAPAIRCSESPARCSKRSTSPQHTFLDCLGRLAVLRSVHMLHSRCCGSIVLLALALTSLGACRSPAAPEQRADAPAALAINIEWTRFVDEFIEAYFVAQPAIAVTKGRHEFDGQLPDWTRAG